MNPIDTLRREHSVIDAVLDCLEAACLSFEEGTAACPDSFHDALAFLRGFAEETHYR